MAAPTQASFLDLVLKSRLVTDAQVNALFPEAADRQNPQAVADGLVKAGLLTRYQVQMIQAGKHRGFFLGPYKILKPLGQGGMGTVFLAEHTSLSRKVAVKVLPPDKAKDKLTLERFNREARAAAALDHPNIVRLHDISQGNGVHFLVMEYVEGTDLQSLMGQTGPLHYAQAAQYVAQAAAGLQHAHDKGFIHRDVKPANLMLTKVGGGIKILDMGLARSFTDSKDALTANLAEGDIAGTVDYLSPEQAMNQPLDERSDIYSLGATFYSLVAGHPPFKGTTAQKLMQHQLKEPPSVSLKLSGRVPQALSDVISKMMAKKPSERFQSAADVVDALGPWLPVPTTGSIITDPSVATPMPSARSSGRTQPIRKSSRMHLTGGEQPPATPLWKRTPVLVGVGIGLLMLVGGIVAGIALSGGKPADPTRPTTTAPVWQPPSPNSHPTPPKYDPPKGAPAAVAGREVFRLDTAAIPAFRNTKAGNRVTSGSQPEFGKGVYFYAHKAETTGEYFCEEADGRKALGWANLSGDPTGQIGVELERAGGNPTPAAVTPLAAGRRYRTRVTYKTAGGGRGSSYVQTGGDWKTVQNGYAELPDTRGEWKTVEYTWEKPDKPVRLLVDNKAVGEGKYLYVREVSVAEADAPAADGQTVYRLDTSRVEPFRESVDSKNSPNYEHLAKVLPGWMGQTWKEGTAADFLADRADGKVALGVAPKEGENTAQWTFRPKDVPGLTLAPGRTYRARVEYKTDAGTSGWAHLATMGDWAQIGGSKLDESGEWKAVTFEFTPPANKELQFSFGTSGPPGGFLRLRAFDITDSAAAAAGRPLYALDLSQQKAFRDRGRTDPNANGTGNWAWKSAEKSGDGTLPTGWTGFPWKLEDETEYLAEEVDGKMALGFRTTQGAGSAMMFTPRIDFPTAAARLTVEYRTEPGQKVNLYTKFQQTKPTGERARDLKMLPPTDGLWRTEAVDVDLNGATGGFFELHNNHGNGATIHVRGLVVTDPTAQAAAPPPPAPRSNTPVVPVKADFAGFGVGTYSFDNEAGVGPADGWAANAFEPAAAGELITTTDGGAKAVALVNKAGKPSAQLYQTKPGGTLAAGGSYLLKLEYKATDGTTGQLAVREKDVGNWKDCPYSFPLAATGDKWETRTFEVETARDYPAVFVVQNLSDAAGNKLSVRKLELVPIGR